MNQFERPVALKPSSKLSPRLLRFKKFLKGHPQEPLASPVFPRLRKKSSLQGLKKRFGLDSTNDNYFKLGTGKETEVDQVLLTTTAMSSSPESKFSPQQPPQLSIEGTKTYSWGIESSPKSLSESQRVGMVTWGQSPTKGSVGKGYQIISEDNTASATKEVANKKTENITFNLTAKTVITDESLGKHNGKAHKDIVFGLKKHADDEDGEDEDDEEEEDGSNSSQFSFIRHRTTSVSHYKSKDQISLEQGNFIDVDDLADYDEDMNWDDHGELDESADLFNRDIFGFDKPKVYSLEL